MILGLIGGAGSGKSAATDILQKEYGFQVLKTDDIAKQLMREDEQLKEKLRKTFGSRIYSPDGLLDKKAYAELIYSDPENRRKSDAIVHPAVWEEVRRRIREEKNLHTVIETALPGPQLKDICDRILFIQAAPEVRIRRMMDHRNYTREYAESILRNQKDDAYFAGLADRTVVNEQGLKELQEAIATAVEEIPEPGEKPENSL